MHGTEEHQAALLDAVRGVRMELGTIAVALTRLAQQQPQFATERERLAFAFMPAAVAGKPLKPEKVTNPASRAALLAFNLAESFDYWREHAQKEREGPDPDPRDGSGGGY